MRHGLLAVFYFFILAPVIFADPEVHSFFPNTPALLGKPIFWSVKVSYPLWEDYTLRTHAPAGLRMEVAGRRVIQEAGQIAVFYRIQLTPQDLNIRGTPVIELVDQKGQAVVLNGKPVKVNIISGNSLQLRQPETPHFAVMQAEKLNWALAALGLLGLTVILFSRFRSNTPKAQLLRGLKKARAEMQKGHLPFALWKLLRSELLWGFRADACTASQLKEQAGGKEAFVRVAQMLEDMEQMRYSGQKEMRPLPAFQTAVDAAIARIAANRRRRK